MLPGGDEAWRRLVRAREACETVDTVVAGRRFSARRTTAAPAAPAPVAVLVAGLGLSGQYLLPLAAELGPRLPVWVPDLPGYGRSAGLRRAFDMVELADLVVAWMDAVGVDRAALVGNSAGCQIAVEAAARHPDRVTHLVLEAPTMDADARSVPRHAVRIALDALREPVSLIPLQVADWLRTGPRRLASAVGHAFDHAVETRLGDVTCPALVVRGARGPDRPPGVGRARRRRAARGSLRVVPGTHAMTYSDPERLAALVVDFLSGEAG